MVKFQILCTNYVPLICCGVQRNMRCGTQTNLITAEMNSQNHISGNCVYTIRANSLRVCQLRVDFNSILAGPSITTATCVDDAISIDELHICGTNMDQHGKHTKLICKLTVLTLM